MNLDTFISETLTSIARGVEAAAKELADSDAVVSPAAIRSAGDHRQKHYGYYSKQMDPEGFERLCRVAGLFGG